MFATVSHFHPSQIFVTKARRQPLELSPIRVKVTECHDFRVTVIYAECHIKALFLSHYAECCGTVIGISDSVTNAGIPDVDNCLNSDHLLISVFFNLSQDICGFIEQS